MTDLRPYFTKIIGHNSVNVHRIPTKVSTEICLNEPFKCAKFQPDPSTHSCFMADLRSVRNEVEEEKKVTIIPRNGTERNGIFRGIILRNGTEQTYVSPNASLFFFFFLTIRIMMK